MKKTYETPSVQIEKFDLQDPEIHTVWESHEDVVDPWLY